MRHVFICGACGIGPRGGYEIFLDKLTEYMSYHYDVKLHVACREPSGHEATGYIPEGAVSCGEHEFEYHGAHCFMIRAEDRKMSTAIWYDLESVHYCLRYCKVHRIEKPVLFLLTCRIGPFLGPIRRKLHAIGGTLHVNPGVHIWTRPKWKKPEAKYLQVSEAMSVRYADVVISDSKYGVRYIKKTYPQIRANPIYIPYGTERAPDVPAEKSEAYKEWARANGVREGEYYYTIGRISSENNSFTILDEFIDSDTNKKLVLITDIDDELYSELDQKLHLGDDKRIVFASPVYGPLLDEIRSRAFAYIHGREACSTHISLLKGLALTKLNLIYYTEANTEAGGCMALYWTKTTGSLAALIEDCEEMKESEIDDYTRTSRRRMEDKYSWLSVALAYSEIWNT